MDLFTFNPPNRFISIDDSPYELGAFSIKIMSLINVKYGSLVAFNDILKREKETGGKLSIEFLDCMTWLSYNLLIEKKTNIKELEFSKIFNDELKKGADNIITVIKTIKDGHQLEAPKSKTSKKSNTEDNFAELYVHISSVIKFTIKEFYELTSRQIFQISSEVTKAKNKDFELQCALHGADVKKPVDNRPASEINFTPQENEDLAEIMKTRMDEITKERANLYN